MPQTTIVFETHAASLDNESGHASGWHRATGYALAHLLGGRPLAEVVAAPWQWQPGWRYTLDGPDAGASGRPLPSRPS